MNKTLSTISLMFGAIGIALLIGAGFGYYNVRHFIDRAARAEGTVIDLKLSYSSNSSPTYTPVVRFTLPQGNSIVFAPNFSSNPPAYSRGETVTVLYDPAKPQDAKIDGFFAVWLGPLILGFIGAVFSIIAAIMRIVWRGQARARAELRATGTPVEAQVQRVEQSAALKINHRHPFRVVAQWHNPTTQKVHVFTSEYLAFDPSPYMQDRKTVTVFIAPDNPRKFYVDLTFLPELAQ